MKVLACLLGGLLLMAAKPAPPPEGMVQTRLSYRDSNPENCQPPVSDPWYAPESPDHVPAHEDTYLMRTWQGTGDLTDIYTVCGPNGRQGSTALSLRVAFDPRYRSASGYIVGPTGEVRDFIPVEGPGAIRDEGFVTLGACFMPYLTLNGMTGDNRYITPGTYAFVVTDGGSTGARPRRGDITDIAVFAFGRMGYWDAQQLCPPRDQHWDGLPHHVGGEG